MLPGKRIVSGARVQRIVRNCQDVSAMQRHLFRKTFKTLGPAVLPVIHVLDGQQTLRNVAAIMGAGAQGVFLINHDFEQGKLVPIIQQVRQRFPALWLGVNFLAVTGREAFVTLGKLEAKGCPVDAYWADDARIDERADAQTEADKIKQIRRESGWSGLYFGGTAFKKQRPVAEADYPRAARLACGYMDCVTTSGAATAVAADPGKIEVFRKAIGDHALAVASGVTPENVHVYGPLVDAILVASGINLEGDFYNVDVGKLTDLLERLRKLENNNDK